MTYDEYLEKAGYGGEIREIWNAAQKAERERIKDIIKDSASVFRRDYVAPGGWVRCCNQILERIEARPEDTTNPEGVPTAALRWFNPFPYDGCRLQQAWVKQDGSCEFEWRDVPTEE